MAIELAHSADRDDLVELHVSPACELYFAVFVAQLLAGAPGRGQRCRSFDALEQRLDLVTRAKEHWATSAVSEWLELLVIAEQHDCLAAPPEALIEAISLGPTAIPEPGSFWTEDPGTREELSRRLRRLQESAQLRSEYASILRDIWSAVEPSWQAGGGQAELAVEEGRRHLQNTSGPYPLIPPGHLAHRPPYSAVLQDAVERQRLRLVPLCLAGEGALFVALPDSVLVGYGVDYVRSDSITRERAEGAAQRLRVLSEPTRLTLLKALLMQPASVTELSTRFGVSQPSVSMHIKMLRDAGLLTSERIGNQTLYRADLDGVNRLVDEARAFVLAS